MRMNLNFQPRNIFFASFWVNLPLLLCKLLCGSPRILTTVVFTMLKKSTMSQKFISTFLGMPSTCYALQGLRKMYQDHALSSA